MSERSNVVPLPEPSEETAERDQAWSVQLSGDLKWMVKAAKSSTANAQHDRKDFPCFSHIFVESVVDKDLRLLRMVATDSYRMTVAELSWQGEGTFRVLVPAKELEAAVKAVKLKVTSIGISNTGLTVDGTVVNGHDPGTPLDHCYPNWKAIVDRIEHAGQVTIDVPAMVAECKAKIKQYGRGHYKRIGAGNGNNMECFVNVGKPDGVGVGLRSGEVPPDIYFNPIYLKDALESFGLQRVVMHVQSARKPAMIDVAIPGVRTRILLMPVVPPPTAPTKK